MSSLAWMAVMTIGSVVCAIVVVVGLLLVIGAWVRDEIDEDLKDL